MRLRNLIIFQITIIFNLWPLAAHAYIGPGAAVAFLGYVFGPIAAIVISVGLVFAWIGRMIWKKVKHAPKAPEE